MVGWYEREMYDRNKRADLYGTGYRVGSPVLNITPFTIFKEKLNKDKRFMRLKGYSAWSLSLDANAQYYKRWYRYSERCEPSDWYLYRGEGDRRAIVCIPEYSDMRSKVFLKILWVPPTIAGSGVGTEVMEVLKSIVRKVDDIAKSGERYRDKNVSCCSFVIYLIPNSFAVKEGYWDVEAIENRTDGINWSANPEAEEKDGDPDFEMVDETFSYMDKGRIRLNLKELQRFYKDKCGFVTCEELAIDETINWETGNISRDLNITARSFCHQRWPLLWPPENLKFHDRVKEE
jgi:hypothetical protein